MKILLTGASGFIGSALLSKLSKSKDTAIVISSRTAVQNTNSQVEQFIIDGIDAQTNWSSALRGVDVVIHAAAVTSAKNDYSKDPFVSIFRPVNVDGTVNLARQGAKHGVSRFVFISSIKVNGESTLLGSSVEALLLSCLIDSLRAKR